MRNTGRKEDVTGGKPIAVLLQSISSVSAIKPLVAFYDIHGGKRCYFFILSRTPHETYQAYTLTIVHTALITISTENFATGVNC
jgi:hypothetical protein